ncbi:hypothetical protein [Lishizhenia tianjinensis]|nr:hypothetical protein [Lishizhenia tianjinensis]
MTAYYESTLRTRGNSRTYLKAGLGYYAVFGRGGMHVIGNLGWYGGGVKHKIECGGGLDYFILGDLQGAIPLSASLGYRFQKPQKRFLFRTGFSYPEGVYIGAGYRF